MRPMFSLFGQHRPQHSAQPTAHVLCVMCRSNLGQSRHTSTNICPNRPIQVWADARLAEQCFHNCGYVSPAKFGVGEPVSRGATCSHVEPREHLRSDPTRTCRCMRVRIEASIVLRRSKRCLRCIVARAMARSGNTRKHRTQPGLARRCGVAYSCICSQAGTLRSVNTLSRQMHLLRGFATRVSTECATSDRAKVRYHQSGRPQRCGREVGRIACLEGGSWVSHTFGWAFASMYLHMPPPHKLTCSSAVPWWPQSVYLERSGNWPHTGMLRSLSGHGSVDAALS